MKTKENGNCGPVDVLAELRNAANYITDWRQEPEEELWAAVAAVAELVTKSGNLSDYLDAYLDWQREQGDEAGLAIAENDIADFRAALAKFGGAK